MSDNLKVLIINGSPRVNGNTSIAVREMEEIFQKENITVEHVQIGMKDIRGCIGCGRCFELGKCVFDDIVNELAPKYDLLDEEYRIGKRAVWSA